MGEWIYFLHVDRENFVDTMTPDEIAAWELHSEMLENMLAEGSLILAGPTLGRINTGVIVFEAPDEEAARGVMEADPTIVRGFARGELRPFRAAMLRGRD
jgi:uncharacterized protein YciI